MSLLLIDWGNTCLKWAVAVDAQVGKVQAVILGERLPPALNELEVQEIWAATVRSLEDRLRFSALCLERWGVTVAWAQSTDRAAGVVNGYAEPERLGVDRWLTLLAVHRLNLGHSIIVDAGTAVTVDFLSAAGVHSGGYILPGYRLMHEALLQQTAALHGRLEMVEDCVPACSTTEAIMRGIHLAILGGIEQATKQAQIQWAGASFHGVVTGGDAVRLQSWWPDGVLWRPALVLEGLLVWGAC